MSEGERLQQIFEGYEWSEFARLWEKRLEDGMHSLPEIGEGHFVRIHSVDEDYNRPTLTDLFLIKVKLVLGREIDPYPIYQPWAKVKVEVKDPHNYFPQFGFTNCYFEYWKDWESIKRSANNRPPNYLPVSNPLNIGSYGVYRAFYDFDGNLVSLAFNTPDSPFVSFNFSKDEVTDSDSNQLGQLGGFLNTGRKLLFNEKFFVIEQSGQKVTAREIRPGIHERTLAIVTVPKQVPIDKVRTVLISDSREWLQLPELIPVKLEMTQEDKS